MGGLARRPTYLLPCCGRQSYVAAPGPMCMECATAATPLDDPAAVAFRARVAARDESLIASPTDGDA